MCVLLEQQVLQYTTLCHQPEQVMVASKEDVQPVSSSTTYLLLQVVWAAFQVEVLGLTAPIRAEHVMAKRGAQAVQQ